MRSVGAVCVRGVEEGDGWGRRRRRRRRGTCEISRRASDMLSKSEKAYGGQ
jgi:hypothetical protein